MRGLRGYRLALRDAFHNFVGESVEGTDEIGDSGGDDCARHSPDYGGGFILSIDFAACIVDRGGAECAIATHPGHHHREGVRPEYAGYRAKENVDGGTA